MVGHVCHLEPRPCSAKVAVLTPMSRQSGSVLKGLHARVSKDRDTASLVGSNGYQLEPSRCGIADGIAVRRHNGCDGVSLVFLHMCVTAVSCGNSSILPRLMLRRWRGPRCD